MQSLHVWLTLPSWKLCNSLYNVAFFQCHRAGTAPFAASPPECRGHDFCCCQCSQKVISLCVVWYLISVLISLKTQWNKGAIQFECVQFHHEGLRTTTTKVLQSQELTIPKKKWRKGKRNHATWTYITSGRNIITFVHALNLRKYWEFCHMAWPLCLRTCNLRTTVKWNWPLAKYWLSCRMKWNDWVVLL